MQAKIKFKNLETSTKLRIIEALLNWPFGVPTTAYPEACRVRQKQAILDIDKRLKATCIIYQISVTIKEHSESPCKATWLYFDICLTST